MKKMRESFKTHRFLYQLIGGMLYITAVSVLLFMLAVSVNSSNILKKEIINGKQTELNQIAGSVNFRAEYVSNIMQSALRDKNIAVLLYTNNGADIMPGLRALSELRQSVKHLSSVYIYNQDRQEIYISSATQAYAIRGIDQFDDTGFFDILSHIEDYPKFNPILRLVSYTEPTGRRHEEYVYTYLQYTSYTDGSIRDIMAFNFSGSWIGDALQYINPGTDGDSVWIIGKDRQIIYSGNAALIGTSADKSRFPDSVLTQGSGSLINKGPGRSKEILVYTSPEHFGYKQWSFVSVVDYAKVQGPVNHLKRITYLIALLVLTGSLGGIFFFSRSMYKPVRSVIDEAERLSLEQAKKRAMERDIYLRKLLHGDITAKPSQIRETLSEYGMLNLFDREIRCLLISIDRRADFELRYQGCTEETERAIEEIIRTSVEQNGQAFFPVKMEGHWCVCIQAEESGDTVDLQSVFDEINRKLTERFKLTVSAAVSSAGNSVSDISCLYTEAVNNLSCRFLLGHRQLLTPETVRDYGSESYSYPQETEVKLIACLKGGKMEKAISCYKQFVEQIRLFPVEDIRLSFVLLLNDIKRAFNNSAQDVSAIFIKPIQSLQKPDEMETLEEVNQQFLHLFWEITEKIQDRTSQKYDQLIQQAKDYIAEHYGEISLSMNEVADHLDISATTLSRLFKQTDGTSFPDYLSSCRLEAACDLIIHTDKTFAEISDLVGFTNCSYFYIVFKKRMNCTPNQYRKQGREGSGENTENDEKEDTSDEPPMPGDAEELVKPDNPEEES